MQYLMASSTINVCYCIQTVKRLVKADDQFSDFGYWAVQLEIRNSGRRADIGERNEVFFFFWRC